MRRLAIAGVVALFVYFVAATWTGIDFGNHWDEYPTVLQRVGLSLQHGTILPARYLHPSLLHEITLATAVVTQGDVESKTFLLRMRRIVAVISALTIVWVFLLVLVWRESPLEALLAAAIAAGSWELQYHSRWLTVDPLMVQFAALSVFCAVAGHRRNSPWLLRASAVAAGLACGSKYTAGLLLITVIVACWFDRARRRRVVEGLLLFAAGYLIAVPGAIPDVALMLSDVMVQARIYSSGWGVYSVSPPFEHARLLAEYIGLVLLSHTPLIAAFLTLCAAGGVILAAREDHRTAMIALSFPVAYLLYFATQRVMFVRNTIVVVPFLAAFAAIGIGALLERGIRAPALRWVAAAAVAVLLMVNLAWLWTAARTIKRPTREYVAQLAEYLDAHPDRRFAISPRVLAELYAFDGRQRPAIASHAPGVDAVVFFALDFPHMGVIANRRDTVERWFGAQEVNFNYYPTWPAADRVLVVHPRKLIRD